MAKLIRLEMEFKDFGRLAIYAMDHAQDAPEMEYLNKLLQDKLNKLVDNDLYTKSKCAPTAEEREKARSEYLDRKGVPNSFRW